MDLSYLQLNVLAQKQYQFNETLLTSDLNEIYSMKAIYFVNRQLKEINLSDYVDNLTFVLFASLFQININLAKLNFGNFI